MNPASVSSTSLEWEISAAVFSLSAVLVAAYSSTKHGRTSEKRQTASSSNHHGASKQQQHQQKNDGDVVVVSKDIDSCWDTSSATESSSSGSSNSSSSSLQNAETEATATTSLGEVAGTQRQRRSSSKALASIHDNLGRGSQAKRQVFHMRQRHFSERLSVSYANTDPLMLVEGFGARMVDESGISYLDTRNNVAHCGHCHPHVVEAIQHQVALLNTNTRYLHPNITRLGERLLEKFPPSLNKIFFVNSGSEANDLALRLARAYSGGSSNTIVVEGAYHGHTLGVLEISPYKFEKGHEYQPLQRNGSHWAPGPHIWQVPQPDTFRGVFRDPRTAGEQYAQYVQEACDHYQSQGETVRAFIMEGGLSIGGVILPPDGYMEAVVKAVRNAGGVYIADEVQTGFGRYGSCFWAFEHNNSTVVPDIVTLGKPIGNGMPLAAVVCSEQVARAFEDLGVDYFNTFGGNPVSAAAGLAVLDVIEEEGLQQRALRVGKYMQDKFCQAMETVPLIGDVRGSGLFIGIELVRDRETLEPATEETSFLCSIMREKYHVITSIDGLHDNVFVIKPPMVFSEDDVDYFVDCFIRAALDDLPKADLTTAKLTPT